MHYAWVVIHLYSTFCCIIFVHSNFKSFELFSEIPSKINPSKKSDPSAVGVIKGRKNLLYTTIFKPFGKKMSMCIFSLFLLPSGRLILNGRLLSSFVIKEWYFKKLFLIYKMPEVFPLNLWIFTDFFPFCFPFLSLIQSDLSRFR